MNNSIFAKTMENVFVFFYQNIYYNVQTIYSQQKLIKIMIKISQMINITLQTMQ